MTSPARTRLIDQYIAAYNAFDIEGMLAVLAPGIVFENFSGGQVTASSSGIEAFRELAEQSKSFFSEREQRVTDLQEVQDRVVARISYRGRLAVDIPDGPQAGTLIELQGESEFGFSAGDDRIASIVDRS